MATATPYVSAASRRYHSTNVLNVQTEKLRKLLKDDKFILATGLTEAQSVRRQLRYFYNNRPSIEDALKHVQRKLGSSELHTIELQAETEHDEKLVNSLSHRASDDNEELRTDLVKAEEEVKETLLSLLKLPDWVLDPDKLKDFRVWSDARGRDIPVVDTPQTITTWNPDHTSPYWNVLEAQLGQPDPSTGWELDHVGQLIVELDSCAQGFYEEAEANKNLRATVQTLQEQNIGLIDQGAQHERTLAEALEQLAEANAKISRLESDLKTADAVRKIVTVERDTLKSDCQSQLNELDKLRESLSMSDVERQRIEAAQQKGLNDATAKIVDLEERLKWDRAIIEDQADQIATLQEQNQNLQLNRDVQERAAYEELQATYQVQKEELEACKQELASATEELSNARDEMDRLGDDWLALVMAILSNVCNDGVVKQFHLAPLVKAKSLVLSIFKLETDGGREPVHVRFADYYAAEVPERPNNLLQALYLAYGDQEEASWSKDILLHLRWIESAMMPHIAKEPLVVPFLYEHLGSILASSAEDVEFATAAALLSSLQLSYPRSDWKQFLKTLVGNLERGPQSMLRDASIARLVAAGGKELRWLRSMLHPNFISATQALVPSCSTVDLITAIFGDSKTDIMGQRYVVSSNIRGGKLFIVRQENKEYLFIQTEQPNGAMYTEFNDEGLHPGMDSNGRPVLQWGGGRGSISKSDYAAGSEFEFYIKEYYEIAIATSAAYHVTRLLLGQ